jgi:hypothetical protein
MTTKPKRKVVVFDVDETLGNFSQFSIFTHVIQDYFNKTDITYQYFNDLVDLYPEIIRPNMLRILEYIRKKKNDIPGSKVMIYTNNMGPDKWVAHIRKYFEYKLREASSSSSSSSVAIIPPLFDHTIGGFKPQNIASASSDFPQRTTKEKTFNELIRCARLPSDIEVCFLDDVYHDKMIDERVYYIKLQAYYSYIPFDTFVDTFLKSDLYRDVFDKFQVRSIRPGTTTTVKKQILTIELNDMLIKYANMAKYDAKAHQRKMFHRDIDVIISKYILYHLQVFFCDRSPHSNPRMYSRKMTKTSKKNRSSSSSSSSSSSGNVVYVDKENAIKIMRNKTVRKR